MSIEIFEKEIVVGGDIRAILFAYHKKIPIIVNNLFPPLFYEKFENHIDLSKYGFSNGSRKMSVFYYILQMLSINGYTIFHPQISNISYDNKIFNINSRFKTITSVSFETAHIFDDYKITNLDGENRERENFIIDKYKINFGKIYLKKDMLFEDKSEPIKEIYIPKRGIAIGISILRNRDLETSEYSGNILKYEMSAILKEKFEKRFSFSHLSRNKYIIPSCSSKANKKFKIYNQNLEEIMEEPLKEDLYSYNYENIKYNDKGYEKIIK